MHQIICSARRDNLVISYAKDSLIIYHPNRTFVISLHTWGYFSMMAGHTLSEMTWENLEKAYLI